MAMRCDIVAISDLCIVDNNDLLAMFRVDIVVSVDKCEFKKPLDTFADVLAQLKFLVLKTTGIDPNLS